MAYGDGNANRELLGRTLNLTFDGQGRSRRTEIIYWWFATALFSVVANFAVTTSLSLTASTVVADLLSLLTAVPMFALFVRRMHDQDRSGWWSVTFPVSLVFSIFRTVQRLTVGSEQVGYQRLVVQPLSWLVAVASLALLVMLFLPGSVGPNRFGDDPRETGSSAA